MPLGLLMKRRCCTIFSSLESQVIGTGHYDFVPFIKMILHECLNPPPHKLQELKNKKNAHRLRLKQIFMERGHKYGSIFQGLTLQIPFIYSNEDVFGQSDAHMCGLFADISKIGIVCIPWRERQSWHRQRPLSCSCGRTRRYFQQYLCRNAWMQNFLVIFPKIYKEKSLDRN